MAVPDGVGFARPCWAAVRPLLLQGGVMTETLNIKMLLPAGHPV